MLFYYFFKKVLTIFLMIPHYTQLAIGKGNAKDVALTFCLVNLPLCCVLHLWQDVCVSSASKGHVRSKRRLSGQCVRKGESGVNGSAWALQPAATSRNIILTSREARFFSFLCFCSVFVFVSNFLIVFAQWYFYSINYKPNKKIDL